MRGTAAQSECCEGVLVRYSDIVYVPSDYIREPLINYKLSLAYRLVRNRGAALQACRGLPKSCNEECRPGGKPLRARPEAHICGVAPLAKDYGHSLQDAPCSYTLQALPR